jgi:hypothetical protein
MLYLWPCMKTTEQCLLALVQLFLYGAIAIVGNQSSSILSRYHLHKMSLTKITRQQTLQPRKRHLPAKVNGTRQIQPGIPSMYKTSLPLSLSLSLSSSSSSLSHLKHHLSLMRQGPRDAARQDVACTGMLVLPAGAGAVHCGALFAGDDDGVCACEGCGGSG